MNGKGMRAIPSHSLKRSRGRGKAMAIGRWWLLGGALACSLAFAQEQDILDIFDDPHSDPSDFASEVDTDFEADEIVALDLSEHARALLATLGLRIVDER